MTTDEPYTFRAPRSSPLRTPSPRQRIERTA